MNDFRFYAPTEVVFGKNAEALRESLQDLCDHPEKAEEYRAKAREMVSSKYTWQEITAQTHELYRTLLER